MVNIIYDYNTICKNETEVKIAEQEHKDTFIVAQTFGDIFNYDVTVTQTPQYTSYDLDVEINKSKLAVEVKEYNLTEENEKKYGKNVMLKVDKLMRMQQASVGKKLLYTVILNKKDLVIFDCSKVDWASLKIVPIKQKKTQFDPNSEYVYLPTYIIPCKYAVKTVPCEINYWVYEEFEEKPQFEINANNKQT